MYEERKSSTDLHRDELEVFSYRAVHPNDVLLDPRLSVEKKRKILAAWASDANAVEDAPAQRYLPNGTLIGVDDILSALQALDAKQGSPGNSASKRKPRKLIPPFRGLTRRNARDDDDDPPPAPAGAMNPMRFRSGSEADYTSDVMFSQQLCVGQAA
jgi:hypothetical protein